MFDFLLKKLSLTQAHAVMLPVLAFGAWHNAGVAIAPVENAQRCLHLTLTPISKGTPDGPGIDVTYDLTGLSGSPVSLVFDSLKPMLRRTSDQVVGFRAEDAAGALAFTQPIEVRNGSSINQVWRSSRPVEGKLHVSYRVPVASPHTKFRGPQIDLQAAGGGLSGAFVSFLLLPKWEGKMRVHVEWHLPAAQTAVASYGSGNTAQDMDWSSLLNTLFLAGPVQGMPQGKSNGGLSVSALGTDSSTLNEVRDIARSLHTVETDAFHVSASAQFHLLIRSYDGGQMMSGRADTRTFLLYLPTAKPLDRVAIQSLIGHEMVHSLIRDLDDEPGEDGDWYTEGTADYFSIVLPWESHINGVCDYVTLINREAAMYYTNSRRDLPNDALTRVMWTGRDAWTVPYARGAFYFAALNQKLIQHGAGVRVLDLVNEMTRRISRGAPAKNQTWNDLLRDRVGAWAVEDWEGMMKGNVIFPSAAFGSVATGKNLQTGFFSLGFKEPTRLDAGAVIAGLRPESDAARAGLRNGDVLMTSIDLNPFYRSFDKPLTLQVMRRGQNRSITFNPRLGIHPAMIWLPTSSPRPPACQNPS